MNKDMPNNLKQISNSLLLVLTVVFLVGGLLGSVYGLRRNSLRVQELRRVVYAADQSGQNIEPALRDLRAHVLNHMNSDLTRRGLLTIENEKPIQLAYKYYRDNVAAYRTMLENVGADTSVLDRAQASCDAAQVVIGERLGCVNQASVEIGGAQFPRLDPLAKDFYVYDFESPAWSPDLAGVSLVMFALGIFLLGARFLASAWRALRR